MRAAAWTLLLLAGCPKPAPVDLLSVQPDLTRFRTERPCTLSVGPVVDARPVVEREGKPGGVPTAKYVVPLLIYFQWEAAGPRYGRPGLYANDLLPDLQLVLQKALDASSVCTGGGPALTLRPTLRHYFGLSYEKSFAALTIGGGSAVTVSYFPVGQVTLDLELLRGDEVIDRVELTERYLFNPGDPGLSTAQTPTTGAAAAIGEARKLAPRIALERLLARVPHSVDRMLATGSDAPVLPASSFLAVRLTREYDFQEELTIETATGRIVSDQVVRRRLPVLGAPDEWIVAPVDPAGRWMNDEQYRAHVAALGQQYEVDFAGNLTAATLRGLRPVEARVAVPAEPPPPESGEGAPLAIPVQPPAPTP